MVHSPLYTLELFLRHTQIPTNGFKYAVLLFYDGRRRIKPILNVAMHPLRMMEWMNAVFLLPNTVNRYR